MQSNSIMPRRTLVPRRETSTVSTSNVVPTRDAKKSEDAGPSRNQGNTGKQFVVETRNKISVLRETEEDALITPPSISGTITSEDLYDVQRQSKPIAGYKNMDGLSFSLVESQHVPVVDTQKKVQLLLGKHAGSQGNKLSCISSSFLVQKLCRCFWCKFIS